MKSKIVVAIGLSLALLAGARGASAQQLPPGFAYKAGFVNGKTLSGAGSHTNEPVWADLGLGAGRKSIIVGTGSKQLYVVNWDGSIAAGHWPVTLPGVVQSGAAVGDLDGDGIPDIVVGFGGGVGDPVTVGGVMAFKRDGTMLWVRDGFNEAGSSFPLGVVSTPAIGDIDGDGHTDVVWGSFDAHIYAVDGRTGLDKPGWPLFVRDTIWSSPALYDLDGDGKLEVIIGTDSHADPTANPPGVPPTIAGGRLHVLNYFGKEFPGFPYDVDQVIMSAPVVGNITGDGKPKIVFGTGTFYGNPAPCGSGTFPARKRTVYALTCTGQLVPGFGNAGMLSGEVWTSPALADLNGDGLLDVVVTDMDCSTGNAQNFNVYAFRGTDGVQLWKTKPIAYAGVNLSAGQPVVADIGLGVAGHPQVLVPTNTEICILAGDNGAQLTASVPFTGVGYSLYMTGSASSAALDIDNGVLNIAAASQNAGNALVYAWTTPKATAPVWGTFRRDARRNGVATNSGMCAPRPVVQTSFHPITPCRLLDTRNGSLPLGTALEAAKRRNFDITGLCGIPAGAVSISANVTVTNQNAPGDLTIFPSDVGQPITTVISFKAFRTRANNAMIWFSAGSRTFSVYNNSTASVDLILDVNGYFQ